MQISAANLLATQSQMTVRTQGAAAAFEPIAFKEMPAASLAQDTAKKPVSAATNHISPSPAGPAEGYVRPGTNLNITV